MPIKVSEGQRLFGLNDEVRTIKGAAFRGVIIGFHGIGGPNVGCVVEAEHEWFKGTRHVYPLKQLELVRG